MSNSLEKDIEDIKVLLDNTITQLSVVSVKLNIIQSMVLGVYKETLPLDDYKSIYTHFVNDLEEDTTDALNELEGVLFDSKEFLLRQKYNLLEAMNRMKDEDYNISMNTKNSQ